MPRTKQPRKILKTDDDDFITLKEIVKDGMKNIDRCAEMEICNVEIAFKMMTGSIPKEVLQSTVGQLKAELHLREDTNSKLQSSGSDSAKSSRPGSRDEGYLTEGSSSGNKDSGKKDKKPFAVGPPTRSRRSRSANASHASSTRQMPPPLSATRTTQRRRSRSVYRTPAHASSIKYPAITPKMAPNTPLTVLRQPRQGEMVVSMSGSPVMGPPSYVMPCGEQAQCNILLQDGTTLSLQPKELRMSQTYIPFSLMDPNVLNQIKTLKDNLSVVLKMGEKIVN